MNAPPPSVSAPRPILIIDDDDDAHFLLKRQLRKLEIPAPVVSALSGTDAIRYIDACDDPEKLPCMVFLDIKMPGMGGFEVLEWMKNKGLLGKLTVAMFSSSDEQKDVSQAMSLGAHTFLRKTADASVISAIVLSALRLAQKKPRLHEGMKLLIVDDSAFSRRWSRRIAESLGLETHEASSGLEALTVFKTHRFDVVLLDLVMGGGPYGTEVLPELIAADPNIQVIVVTADTQDTTTQRVLATGTARIIRKPISEAKLSEAISVRI